MLEHVAVHVMFNKDIMLPINRKAFTQQVTYNVYFKFSMIKTSTLRKIELMVDQNVVVTFSTEAPLITDSHTLTFHSDKISCGLNLL